MLETQRESVPSNDDGELDTALAFLSFSRSSVLKKLKGLDDEQLRRRLVGSDTTLLGLVQHLTDGERYWFGHTVAGDATYADVDFDIVVPQDRPGAERPRTLTGFVSICTDGSRGHRAGHPVPK